MIIAVVGTIILVLVIAVVVAIARDRGPGPDDVAVAYELAWDRLDFESLFTLSGNELRDGLDRRGYVAAKRSAYNQQPGLGGLAERVGIDQVVSVGDAAVAITTVELRDHSVVHNRVELAATRAGRSWRTGSNRRPNPPARKATLMLDGETLARSC